MQGIHGEVGNWQWCPVRGSIHNIYIHVLNSIMIMDHKPLCYLGSLYDRVYRR